MVAIAKTEVRGLLTIWRPWAIATTVILMVVGLQIGGSVYFPTWQNALVALIAVALFGYGGFAMNDYCDRKLDAFVHPERVIPAGQIKPIVVLCAAFVTLGGGIALSFFLGPANLIVAIASVALICFYAPLKNSWGPLGNIAISLIFAFFVVYGYAAVAPIFNNPALWVMAALFSSPVAGKRL